MSIAEHQRLKILEQAVLDLTARVELLEGPKEPVIALEKRGPGRPPKVKDGH